jgi:HSP20 family protein
MLTRRWQPFNEMLSEMNRLHQEMNQVFGRFGNAETQPFATTFPALNLWEDDERLYVEAELPGMEIEDLELYVDGARHLTIKGLRRQPEVPEGAWHRQERRFGEFSRVFELPVDVDADNVQGRFQNGVLLVKLPKREEVKPRRIEVKCN